MSAGVSTDPVRLVLEGVPRVSFYSGGGPRCPEDICFPAVMTALVDYLGKPGRDDPGRGATHLGCRTCRPLPPGAKVPCTYAHFIGVTGVAAFLSWKPGWAGDNVEIMYMSDDPRAPFERAFRAAGYAFDVHGAGAGLGRATEDHCRREIIASLRRGRPVLALGPVGLLPGHAGVQHGRGVRAWRSVPQERLVCLSARLQLHHHR